MSTCRSTAGGPGRRRSYRAFGELDVDEATARKALVRSATEGWLERRQEGRRARWRLTESGRATATEARDRVYMFRSGRDDWNGEWLLLQVIAPDDSTRLRLRRRLGWAGFALLPSGLAITPHVEREEEAHRVLDSLGLGDDAVSFRAVLGSIGVPTRMIASAWELDELAGLYREFIRQTKAARPRSETEVFVAHTKLVHEWRRFPYLDPGLPSEFLPRSWVGREAKVVYDDRYTKWRDPANDWFRGTEQASAP